MSVSISNGDASGRNRRTKHGMLWRVLAMLALLPVILPVIGMMLLWLAHRFDWPPWVLGAIGLLATAGGLYAWWRTLRVRACRFSLRTALIVFAVAGLLPGLAGRWILRTWRHAGAVAEVTGSGGGYVDYEYRYHSRWDVERNWLQARVGYDPFARVECLYVRRDRALTALVQHCEEFPDLEWLTFRWGVTDAGLQHAAEFNRFPRLVNGEFSGTPLTDAGLAHLAGWTNLHELWFSQCGKFTEDGLAHLATLPNLRTLTFFDQGSVKMSVTDAGLAHLGKMRQLRFLRLHNLPITDEGVRHLHGLSNLEELCLRGTRVSEQGLEELYRALPDCRIISDTERLPQLVQIRQLSVWDLRSPAKQLVRITQPERISKIRTLIHHFPSTGGGFFTRSELALHIQIDFDGAHRSLCQMRLGRGVLRCRIREMWGGWSISDQQTEELLGLLGLDKAHLGWDGE